MYTTACVTLIEARGDKGAHEILFCNISFIAFIADNTITLYLAKVLLFGNISIKLNVGYMIPLL